MKRIISSILALVFVLTALSALAPSISAESGTISESEAKELVEKAYQFFLDAQIDGFAENLIDHQSKDVCEIYNSELGRTLVYHPVDESKLPGGSYSAMCKLAKEIYTEEIAEHAYQDSASSLGLYQIQMYYVAENGKVYGQGQRDYAGYDVHVSIENRNYYDSLTDGEIQLKIISGDSKKASAIITVGFYYADAPRPYYHEAVECKFENTADGWRIAESEYSVLLATSTSGLSTYRQTHPEIVNPEVYKLIDAEAKYAIDDLVMNFVVEMYCNYYQRYVDYSKREQKEVKEIVKEIIASDGSKSTMRYVEYLPNIGIENIGWAYFTDEFYESFLTKAYHNNAFDMFITEGDTTYMAVIEGADALSFVYDPQQVVVRVIESTDKEATALVYCELKNDGETIPIYVKCRFERFNTFVQWSITDSPFVDMLTSADGFEYTVGEAPETGDRALDTVAVCLALASLALAAVALVRRRREQF